MRAERGDVALLVFALRYGGNDIHTQVLTKARERAERTKSET